MRQQALHDGRVGFALRFHEGSAQKLAVAPKTRSHIRGLMYRLFEKAMLWELIPLERNPMSLVELRGVSKRMKLPRILTEEEFGVLLNELVHPYRSMVLLAGCTGLRVSEVMGLRWTGINFEALAMEVREGYARSQVTKLKSECSQDELPLDPDVASILLEWKRLCPRGRKRADGFNGIDGNRLFEDRFPWGAILVLSNFIFLPLGDKHLQWIATCASPRHSIALLEKRVSLNVRCCSGKDWQPRRA